MLNEKNQLQREIQTATDYIVQLEEKCYQSNQSCIQLLYEMRKMTESHNSETETLKAYILDIKARIPNYIPVKGDEIDKVLA